MILPKGLGFRVRLGFRVFRVRVDGLNLIRVGFRVLGFRVHGSVRFGFKGLGFRVLSLGYKV